MNDDRTRAKILTGSGRGAVGVVQIRGPKALETASTLFQPNRGRSLQDGPSGRPRFGRFAGDEVVALVLETTPRIIEIHGHGGLAVLEAMRNALEAAGVVFDNEPTAGSRSEKLANLLARAETLRVAGVLLDQVNGAWERELLVIRDDKTKTRIEQLLDRAEFGRKLISGWKLALTGRPNVGKSRLLNALAGFDRAIVSPHAGTTRDVVTLRAAIDGWPVVIADTAGIRRDGVGLESAGIERAWQASFDADLVLVVLDRSEPLTVQDHAVMAVHPHALRVANKADLSASWNEQELAAMAISAETGTGLDALIEAISRRLVPAPPAIGTVVPLFAEQVATLRQKLAE